jgi:ABC transporter substrate binding protein
VIPISRTDGQAQCDSLRASQGWSVGVSEMQRREALAILAGAAVAWPLGARAQQKAIPVIGFLCGTSPGPSAPVAAFHQGLSETGYVEGQNVAIEYRWAEGHYDQLPALAADLVGRKVDMIASAGGIAEVLATKSATSTIPIVFASGLDPVEYGVVASLARPGGNLTGVSFLTVELMPKRLELISELVPQAKTIALLVNPNNPNAEPIITKAAGSSPRERLAARNPEGRHNFRDRYCLRVLCPTARRPAHRRFRSVSCQPARTAHRACITPCDAGVLSRA